jgi:hypothetical protein
MATPDVQPNRWNTPIVVKMYRGERVSDTTHFSDLQMAYLSVKSELRNHANENFNDLPTFLQFAADMDEIWAEQMTGVILAESDNFRFDVYYNVNGQYSHLNDEDEEDEEDEEWVPNNQGVYVPPVVYVPSPNGPSPNVPRLSIEAIARALDAMRIANGNQ